MYSLDALQEPDCLNLTRFADPYVLFFSPPEPRSMTEAKIKFVDYRYERAIVD